MNKSFFSYIYIVAGTFTSINCNNLSENEKNGRDIIEYTFNKTQVKLIEQKEAIKEEKLPIYIIPEFKEKNRNHYGDRPLDSQIDSILMHYTVGSYISSFNTFIKNIPDNRTSAHYLITEKEENYIDGGDVIQVVPENKESWHAGISKWQNTENLNHSSIGIENVNKGFSNKNLIKGCFGKIGLYKEKESKEIDWYKFDNKQIESLGVLSREIIKKYKINPTRIVGHSDIAPGRKQDPGIIFPWGQLCNNYGVGAWLDPNEVDIKFINKMYEPKEPFVKEVNYAFTSKLLSQYGYNIEPTGYKNEQFDSVLCAFQSHFSRNQYPEEYNSKLEVKDQSYIYGLTTKYNKYLKF